MYSSPGGNIKVEIKYRNASYLVSSSLAACAAKI